MNGSDMPSRLTIAEIDALDREDFRRGSTRRRALPDPVEESWRLYEAARSLNVFEGDFPNPWPAVDPEAWLDNLRLLDDEWRERYRARIAAASELLQAALRIVSAEPVTCEGCGRSFIARADARWCSPACRQRAYRDRTTGKCLTCHGRGLVSIGSEARPVDTICPTCHGTGRADAEGVG